MATERLHGVLYLEKFNIGCDLATLGSVFDITIGGVPGKLALPREPKEWPDALKDMRLRSPEAKGGPVWRDALDWGHAYSYSPPRDGKERQASFKLEHLYLSFEVPSGDVEEFCQTVAADRWRWLYQFCGYYDLIFKHKLSKN